jgi:hypothetical protein
MTINPLSSVSSALLSLSGVSPTVGAVAAAGARSLALGVAGEVGGYLLATLSGPVVTGRGAPHPVAYGIEGLAEVLGQATGASPLEVIDLEQALSELATAVASDFVAMADGRTLDRLETGIAALGPDEGPASAGQVSERIHTLAALLAEAR